MGEVIKVRCFVDTCNYWGKGDVCKADQIEVRNVSPGRGDVEYGTIGAFKATTSEDTCCGTFRPAKSPDR